MLPKPRRDMRFARFEHAGNARFGILDGQGVRAFAAPVDSLQKYLALEARDRAALATEPPVPLDDVRLLAPIRPEKNVFCVGRNYMGHAEEGARARGIAR